MPDGLTARLCSGRGLVEDAAPVVAVAAPERAAQREAACGGARAVGDKSQVWRERAQVEVLDHGRLIIGFGDQQVEDFVAGPEASGRADLGEVRVEQCGDARRVAAEFGLHQLQFEVEQVVAEWVVALFHVRFQARLIP